MSELTDGEGQVTIDGVRHWYRVAGAQHRSIPLVIVHGGPGGNVYNFERTIGPRLEEFATLLYYEQRGSGRSKAPDDPTDYSMPVLVSDLDGLREALDVELMSLLGFSFGAELALEYALAHPENVQSLVLQCPTVAMPGRLAWVQLYGFYQVAHGELKKKIWDEIVGCGDPERKLDTVWQIVDSDTVDRFLFHDPQLAALNRRMWNESGLVNTGDMATALAQAESSEPPLFVRVGGVRQPVLLLAGLYDRNVGLEAVRDLTDVFSNAGLVVFEHSAHFPDIEETHKYAESVKRFLSYST